MFYELLRGQGQGDRGWWGVGGRSGVQEGRKKGREAEC